MRSLEVVLPLMLALSSVVVVADQVGFKNGDRLTGAILKADTKSLVIRTAIAGEVTVSWQEIEELHSDLPLHLEFTNGKVLASAINTREGKLEIVTHTGGTMTLPKESVVALRNDAEQLAYERSLHKSVVRGWNGSLDAGLELTRGNSETRNFRIAFRATRKIARDEVVLYAESLYSIDDLTRASPHVIANEDKGGARFARNFSSRLLAFANADFMSDDLQDLNLRSVLGGGIGYHLIKSDRATLKLLGGANFTRENYVEIQRNLAAGQVGEELSVGLGKNTSLIENLIFFPNLTERGGNYRAEFRLGTETKIVKWLGWQTNFTDTYVTNPPIGKKQNEFVFTSGLHFAFSH